MFGYDKYIQGVNERAGCDASYVHSVLNPSHEDAAVRIPEPFGRPSTTCQIRMQLIAKSSLANGQLMAYWFPKAIFNSGQVVFSYFTDGTTQVNIQVLTASPTQNSTFGRDWSSIAAFHRLVSAECKIDYIGRLDESSGLVSCALLHTNVLTTGSLLDAVRDGYFYHGGKAQDGIRMIYMPLDNKDVEYTRAGVLFDSDVDNAENHRYCIVGYGLPTDKFLFNVELTFNVEYIPHTSQIEYVPTGVSTSTLLEESLSKITQVSRQDGVVTNSATGFESVMGGAIGALLGNLVGGEKGAVAGASVGSNFNPFAGAKSYDQMMSDAQKPFGQRVSNWLDPFPGYGYKKA